MQNIEIDLTKIPENEIRKFLDVCRKQGLDPESVLLEEMKSIVSKGSESRASVPLVAADAEWITTDEVRRLLGYKSERSVLRLRQRGDLKAADYPRRPWHFRRADVIALRDGKIPSSL